MYFFILRPTLFYHLSVLFSIDPCYRFEITNRCICHKWDFDEYKRDLVTVKDIEKRGFTLRIFILRRDYCPEFSVFFYESGFIFQSQEKGIE